MNNHCKECVYHHDAGHPKTTKKELKKYNDWCTKVGKTVDKSIGECKLKNLKSTTEYEQ